MVTIIDYGVGNLGSILNMFKKVGETAQISANPDEIARADKLLLPGVGSFDFGIQSLNQSGLRDILDNKVLKEKTPILGICLGMQLMTHSSEEGILPGLGWIDATVKRFVPNHPGMKVPHMGWSAVEAATTNALLSRLTWPARFYFVHSFYVNCQSAGDVLLQSHYGHDFHAAFHHDNIWGVQFHPEKSHKFGMQLLKSFAEL